MKKKNKKIIAIGSAAIAAGAIPVAIHSTRKNNNNKVSSLNSTLNNKYANISPQQQQNNLGATKRSASQTATSTEKWGFKYVIEGRKHSFKSVKNTNIIKSFIKHEVAGNNSNIKNGSHSTIFKDSKGNIWAMGKGTKLQVLKNGETEWKLASNSNITNGEFGTIIEDSKGNLWSMANGTALQELQNGETNWKPAYGTNIRDGKGSMLFEDSKGILWGVGKGSKVEAFWQGRWSNNGHDSHIVHGENATIFEDAKGVIYVMGKRGFGGDILDRSDGHSYGGMAWTWDFDHDATALKGLGGKVFKDSKGNLWGKTPSSEFKVRRFNSNTWESAYSNIKRSSPSFSMFEDSKGNLWSMGKGTQLQVLRKNSVQWENAGHGSNIQNGENGTIMEDSDGNIWSMSKGKPLQELKNGETQWQTQKGISNGDAGAIVEGPEGDIWFTGANMPLYRIAYKKDLTFNGEVNITKNKNSVHLDKYKFPGAHVEYKVGASNQWKTLTTNTITKNNTENVEFKLVPDDAKTEFTKNNVPKEKLIRGLTSIPNPTSFTVKNTKTAKSSTYNDGEITINIDGFNSSKMILTAKTGGIKIGTIGSYNTSSKSILVSQLPQGKQITFNIELKDKNNNVWASTNNLSRILRTTVNTKTEVPWIVWKNYTPIFDAPKGIDDKISVTLPEPPKNLTASYKIGSGKKITYTGALKLTNVDQGKNLTIYYIPNPNYIWWRPAFDSGETNKAFKIPKYNPTKITKPTSFNAKNTKTAESSTYNDGEITVNIDGYDPSTMKLSASMNGTKIGKIGGYNQTSKTIVVSGLPQGKNIDLEVKLKDAEHTIWKASSTNLSKSITTTVNTLIEIPFIDWQKIDFVYTTPTKIGEKIKTTLPTPPNGIIASYQIDQGPSITYQKKHIIDVNQGQRVDLLYTPGKNYIWARMSFDKGTASSHFIAPSYNPTKITNPTSFNAKNTKTAKSSTYNDGEITVNIDGYDPSTMKLSASMNGTKIGKIGGYNQTSKTIVVSGLPQGKNIDLEVKLKDAEHTIWKASSTNLSKSITTTVNTLIEIPFLDWDKLKLKFSSPTAINDKVTTTLPEPPANTITSYWADGGKKTIYTGKMVLKLDQDKQIGIYIKPKNNYIWKRNAFDSGETFLNFRTPVFTANKIENPTSFTATNTTTAKSSSSKDASVTLKIEGFDDGTMQVSTTKGSLGKYDSKTKTITVTGLTQGQKVDFKIKLKDPDHNVWKTSNTNLSTSLKTTANNKIEIAEIDWNKYSASYSDAKKIGQKIDVTLPTPPKGVDAWYQPNGGTKTPYKGSKVLKGISQGAKGIIIFKPNSTHVWEGPNYGAKETESAFTAPVFTAHKIENPTSFTATNKATAKSSISKDASVTLKIEGFDDGTMQVSTNKGKLSGYDSTTKTITVTGLTQGEKVDFTIKLKDPDHNVWKASTTNLSASVTTEINTKIEAPWIDWDITKPKFSTPDSIGSKVNITLPVPPANIITSYWIDGGKKTPYTTALKIPYVQGKVVGIYVKPKQNYIWAAPAFDNGETHTDFTAPVYTPHEIENPTSFTATNTTTAKSSSSKDASVTLKIEGFDDGTMQVSTTKGSLGKYDSKTKTITVTGLTQGQKVDFKIKLKDPDHNVWKTSNTNLSTSLKTTANNKIEIAEIDWNKYSASYSDAKKIGQKIDVTLPTPPKGVDAWYQPNGGIKTTYKGSEVLKGISQGAKGIIIFKPNSDHVWEGPNYGAKETESAFTAPVFTAHEIENPTSFTATNTTTAKSSISKDASVTLKIEGFDDGTMQVSTNKGKLSGYDSTTKTITVTGLTQGEKVDFTIKLKDPDHNVWKASTTNLSASVTTEINTKIEAPWINWDITKPKFSTPDSIGSKVNITLPVPPANIITSYWIDGGKKTPYTTALKIPYVQGKVVGIYVKPKQNYIWAAPAFDNGETHTDFTAPVYTPHEIENPTSFTATNTTTAKSSSSKDASVTLKIEGFDDGTMQVSTTKGSLGKYDSKTKTITVTGLTQGQKVDFKIKLKDPDHNVWKTTNTNLSTSLKTTVNNKIEITEIDWNKYSASYSDAKKIGQKIDVTLPTPPKGVDAWYQPNGGIKTTYKGSEVLKGISQGAKGIIIFKPNSDHVWEGPNYGAKETESAFTAPVFTAHEIENPTSFTATNTTTAKSSISKDASVTLKIEGFDDGTMQVSTTKGSLGKYDSKTKTITVTGLTQGQKVDFTIKLKDPDHNVWKTTNTNLSTSLKTTVNNKIEIDYLDSNFKAKYSKPTSLNEGVTITLPKPPEHTVASYWIDGGSKTVYTGIKIIKGFSQGKKVGIYVKPDSNAIWKAPALNFDEALVENYSPKFGGGHITNPTAFTAINKDIASSSISKDASVILTIDGFDNSSMKLYSATGHISDFNKTLKTITVTGLTQGQKVDFTIKLKDPDHNVWKTSNTNLSTSLKTTVNNKIEITEIDWNKYSASYSDAKKIGQKIDVTLPTPPKGVDAWYQPNGGIKTTYKGSEVLKGISQGAKGIIIFKPNSDHVWEGPNYGAKETESAFTAPVFTAHEIENPTSFTATNKATAKSSISKDASVTLKIEGFDDGTMQVSTNKGKLSGYDSTTKTITVTGLTQGEKVDFTIKLKDPDHNVWKASTTNLSASVTTEINTKIEAPWIDWDITKPKFSTPDSIGSKVNITLPVPPANIITSYWIDGGKKTPYTTALKIPYVQGKVVGIYVKPKQNYIWAAPAFDNGETHTDFTAPVYTPHEIENPTSFTATNTTTAKSSSSKDASVTLKIEGFDDGTMQVSTTKGSLGKYDSKTKTITVTGLTQGQKVDFTIKLKDPDHNVWKTSNTNLSTSLKTTVNNKIEITEIDWNKYSASYSDAKKIGQKIDVTLPTPPKGVDAWYQPNGGIKTTYNGSKVLKGISQGAKGIIIFKPNSTHVWEGPNYGAKETESAFTAPVFTAHEIENPTSFTATNTTTAKSSISKDASVTLKIEGFDDGTMQVSTNKGKLSGYDSKTKTITVTGLTQGQKVDFTIKLKDPDHNVWKASTTNLSASVTTEINTKIEAPWINWDITKPKFSTPDSIGSKVNITLPVPPANIITSYWIDGGKKTPYTTALKITSVQGKVVGIYVKPKQNYIWAAPAFDNGETHTDFTAPVYTPHEIENPTSFTATNTTTAKSSSSKDASVTLKIEGFDDGTMQVSTTKGSLGKYDSKTKTITVTGLTQGQKVDFTIKLKDPDHNVWKTSNTNLSTSLKTTVNNKIEITEIDWNKYSASYSDAKKIGQKIDVTLPTPPKGVDAWYQPNGGIKTTYNGSKVLKGISQGAKGIIIFKPNSTHVWEGPNYGAKETESAFTAPVFTAHEIENPTSFTATNTTTAKSSISKDASVTLKIEGFDDGTMQVSTNKGKLSGYDSTTKTITVTGLTQGQKVDFTIKLKDPDHNVWKASTTNLSASVTTEINTKIEAPWINWDITKPKFSTPDSIGSKVNITLPVPPANIITSYWIDGGKKTPYTTALKITSVQGKVVGIYVKPKQNYIWAAPAFDNGETHTDFTAPVYTPHEIENPTSFTATNTTTAKSSSSKDASVTLKIEGFDDGTMQVSTTKGSLGKYDSKTKTITVTGLTQGQKVDFKIKLKDPDHNVWKTTNTNLSTSLKTTVNNKNEITEIDWNKYSASYSDAKKIGQKIDVTLPTPPKGVDAWYQPNGGIKTPYKGSEVLKGISQGAKGIIIFKPNSDHVWEGPNYGAKETESAFTAPVFNASKIKTPTSFTATNKATAKSSSSKDASVTLKIEGFDDGTMQVSTTKGSLGKYDSKTKTITVTGLTQGQKVDFKITLKNTDQNVWASNANLSTSLKTTDNNKNEVSKIDWDNYKVLKTAPHTINDNVNVTLPTPPQGVDAWYLLDGLGVKVKTKYTGAKIIKGMSQGTKGTVIFKPNSTHVWEGPNYGNEETKSVFTTPTFNFTRIKNPTSFTAINTKDSSSENSYDSEVTLTIVGFDDSTMKLSAKHNGNTAGKIMNYDSSTHKIKVINLLQGLTIDFNITLNNTKQNIWESNSNLKTSIKIKENKNVALEKFNKDDYLVKYDSSKSEIDSTDVILPAPPKNIVGSYKPEGSTKWIKFDKETTLRNIPLGKEGYISFKPKDGFVWSHPEYGNARKVVSFVTPTSHSDVNPPQSFVVNVAKTASSLEYNDGEAILTIDGFIPNIMNIIVKVGGKPFKSAEIGEYDKNTNKIAITSLPKEKEIKFDIGFKRNGNYEWTSKGSQNLSRTITIGSNIKAKNKQTKSWATISAIIVTFLSMFSALTALFISKRKKRKLD